MTDKIISDPLPPHTIKYESQFFRPTDDIQKGGVKMDLGKIRTDLLPISLMTSVAKVLDLGARKYNDRNWELGMDWSRPYGAALRHLFAYWGGEDRDPETGLSHLAHAATNLAFLIEYAEKEKGKDDRPR